MTASMTLTSISAVYAAGSDSASYFPAEVRSDLEISFEMCGISEIGTVSANDAAFELKFDTTETKNLKVEYSLDGGDAVVSQISVTPDVKSKRFGIDTTNGIHKLNVSVYENGSSISSYEETLYVMDLYERQWMDELSIRGVNSRLYTYQGTEKYDKLMEFTKNSGWRYVRGTQQLWHECEFRKGAYDFKKEDERVNSVLNAGMKLFGSFNQGNGFFYPANATGINSMGNDNTTLVWYLPQTKYSLEGWADFAEASANYRSKYDYDTWAIWNEADLHGLDTSSIFARSQAYADICKSAIIRNLYNGYDTDYALFVGTYDTNYYDYGFKAGLYPYDSSIDHHVYTSSGNNFGFDENRGYEKRINEIENVIIDNGGWKDKTMSETGYTSPKAAGYPSQEEASWHVVKDYATCELNDYAYCIIYNDIDVGTDAAYTEHNFGQIAYDFKPKLSYLSTVAFNNMTEGGICVGELDFGEDNTTRAYVYYKDGEVIVMAWTHRENDEAVNWKPENSTFDIYDVYGNKIESGAHEVNLKKAPVYLKGLSKDWIASAVKFEIEKRSADWSERYSETVSKDINDSFDAEIKSVYNDLNGVCKAEDVKEHMDNLADMASSIIAGGKEGKYSEIEVSRMVYGIYRIIQRLDNLYISIYDGESPAKLINAAEEAEKKADKLYADDMRSMQYSDEILRHAKRYAKNAAAVKDMEYNPSKDGIVAGWQYMEEILCGWFDAFTEYESLTELGYQIQSPYYERKSYVNADVTTTYNVWNYSRRSFYGTLNIYDDNGELVEKSKEFYLDGNGGSKEIKLTLNTARPQDNSGHKFYDVWLVDHNGNKLSKQRTVYEVDDKFEFSSVPCTVNVQELTSIPIEIKNVMNVSTDAYIKVKSDENFEFTQTEYEVNIPASSSVTVNMPIKDIKETEYHHYSFEYEISDSKGSVVLSGEQLLNFTTVVKTEQDIDVQAFNGDISDWKDAYPIYLNAPNEPNKNESWKTAQCSTRAFMKWSDNALYLLCDVYDNFHLQEYQGSKMWQGDSIQVSFDPLNNGALYTNNGTATTYNTDDYELGFSYTANGCEYYAWQSPNGLPGGTVDWFKMVRDNENKVTRYLVKLDKTVVESLNFANGNTIGMNIAVNDADILGRDAFYEFTEGTAGVKNPDKYADFLLSDVKPKNMIQGRASEIFPTTIKNALY